MTNLLSIDTSSKAQQSEATLQHGKDFAYELAKSNEREKLSAQGGAGSKGGDRPNLRGSPSETDMSKGSISSAQSPMVDDSTQAMLMSQTELLKAAVVTPTGITEALLEARVFGWHASAQAYLSELTTADNNSAKFYALEESSVSAATSTAPSQDTDEQLLGSVSDRIASEDVAVASDVGMTSSNQEKVASGDGVSSGALESMALDAQAPGYWAERSLRLIRQRDGGYVAWLRDFRVTDADAPSLVKVVLNDAKARGFALNKIMLNGREVWSSLFSH